MAATVSTINGYILASFRADEFKFGVVVAECQSQHTLLAPHIYAKIFTLIVAVRITWQILVKVTETNH